MWLDGMSYRHIRYYHCLFCHYPFYQISSVFRLGSHVRRFHNLYVWTLLSSSDKQWLVMTQPLHDNTAVTAMSWRGHLCAFTKCLNIWIDLTWGWLCEQAILHKRLCVFAFICIFILDDPNDVELDEKGSMTSSKSICIHFSHEIHAENHYLDFLVNVKCPLPLKRRAIPG